MLKCAKSATQCLPQGYNGPQPSAAETGDDAALEATLRTSELGRRFLADYARQHPTPEVQLLLDAIGRLEGASSAPERGNLPVGVVSELVAMSETISEMRREIGGLSLAGVPSGDALAADCTFNQIVEAATRATSDVLMALEEIQNVSWTLREKGLAPELCDTLDDRAVDIYTACARQEIAGTKSAEAMRLLRDMEHRIDALIDDWRDHETQNLLDSAKALDVSDAFEMAIPRIDAETPGKPMHQAARTNRLVPQEDLAAPRPADEPAPAEASVLDKAPVLAEKLFNGARLFERPGPLTLEELHATQRATLFG